MNPADTAGCQVSPACLAGSAPRLALPPRSSGLASLQRLHPRPHRVPRPPGDCTDKSECESERGRVARGKLFHNLPESTGGKTSGPRQKMKKKKKKQAFPRITRTPRPKKPSLPLRFATDSFKLRSCGCKLAHRLTSQPWLLPSSRAHPPGGGSGSHNHACLSHTLLAHRASAAPHGPGCRSQGEPGSPRGSRSRFSWKASELLPGVPYSLVSSS